MSSKPKMVKLKLETTDGFVETLWAVPMGPDLYKLENSPFYAYNVSWLDTVEAHPDSLGQLAMTRVVAKSGHRTLRIVLQAPLAENGQGAALLEELLRLGCGYEGIRSRYIAVDIPPEINIEEVTQLLIASGEQWEYADPSPGTLDGVTIDGGE